jgi:hypothetical protein
LHERAKVEIQLRGTAREVKRFGSGVLQRVNDEINGFAVHHLGALRTGRNVAMHAGLIAFVAEVHLQSAHTAAAQRRERSALAIEAGEYSVHEELL